MKKTKPQIQLCLSIYFLKLGLNCLSFTQELGMGNSVYETTKIAYHYWWHSSREKLGFSF